MRKFLSLFLSLVLSTSPAFAQVNSDGTNSSSDYGPNFLVNGDFYRSVLVGTSDRTNVNLTSGTTATTGFNLGLKHLVVSQGTNAASSFALDIDFAKVNDGYTKTTKQCTLRFDYFLDEVGTGTWQTHVGTSTSAASSSIISLTPTYSSLLGGDQKAGTVLLPFPCSKLLTDKVWIYKDAGGSRAINMGKVFVEYNQGPFGYIQPPNTFTAKVSATGIVTRITGGDYINGTSFPPVSTSLYTILFKNLTSPPNCQVSMEKGSDASALQIRKWSDETNTQLQVYTSYSSTGVSASASPYPFTFSCTKTGADYSQPALTVQDMDYKVDNWTPSMQGFGTITVKGCQYERDGSKLKGLCNIQAGTVPAGTQARINFPPGIPAVSSTYTNRRIVGTVWRYLGNSVGRKRVILHGFAGDSFLTFGNDDYNTSQTPFSTINSDNFINSSEDISFKFEVDIKGWGAVTAPPIAGLVTTSSATSTERIERLSFGGASEVSDCTSSPCTIYRSTSPGNISVTRSSLGNYSIIFAKPFGDKISCWLAHTRGNNVGIAIRTSVPSTTTYNFSGRAIVGGAEQDMGFDVLCSGPAN